MLAQPARDRAPSHLQPSWYRHCRISGRFLHSRSRVLVRQYMKKFCIIFIAVTILGTKFSPAGESLKHCQEVLSGAEHLVLVTSRDMNQSEGIVRYYEKSRDRRTWVEIEVAHKAVLGHAGLGWGYQFDHLRQGGEPVKKEGDRRTPAGIFRLGPSFGFNSNSSIPDYKIIEKGKTFCVDDPTSPYYNQIVDAADVSQKVSGERMWKISVYEKGVVVRYPTNRKSARGSCIFFHIWRSSNSPTLGCIGVSEGDIKTLQEFSKKKTFVAIIPENALKRFSGCLPQTVSN